MNRKDRILIAILSNVVLSLVLFLSADKPARESVERAEAIALSCPVKTPIVAALPELTPAPVVTPSKKEVPVQPVSLPKLDPPKVEAVAAAIVQTAGHVETQKIIVKSGDKLEKIAKTYGCSVELLRNLNHLTDDRLHVGQVLLVPLHSSKVVVQASEQHSAETSEDAVYYTVKNGDSLWTIAMKNHVKVEELSRLNQISDEKAKKLKPGDKLRIR